MGQNSDKSWFELYLIDFWIFSYLKKELKSYLELVLKFIRGQNSNNSWFDSYLIDLVPLEFEPLLPTTAQSSPVQSIIQASLSFIKLRFTYLLQS